MDDYVNKVASDGDHVDVVVMGCASRVGPPKSVQCCVARRFQR